VIYANEKVNYRAAGEDGTAVILIHGIPSSLKVWDFLFQGLVSNGFRALALDLLGHGSSYQPENRSGYTVAAAYEFFEDWVSGFGLKSPSVVIGHSFGGHLAIKYALNNPDKVRALILIDPFLTFDQFRWINRIVFSNPDLAAFLYPLIPAWLIKASIGLGSLRMEKFRIRSYLSGDELAKVANDYKRCSPKVAYFPRSVSDKAFRYAEIKAPTLLMWGKNDLTLSPRWYQEIVSRAPNWSYTVLNAGHNPYLSKPDEVNARIFEFLKSNSI